jgi:hypothetical protein
VSDEERRNPTPLGWTAIPARTPKVGEELWRVSRDGRTISYELRDVQRTGAGWDVLIQQDGELSFSRRCADEALARFVANALKQDHVKAGWTEVIVG